MAKEDEREGPGHGLVNAERVVRHDDAHAFMPDPSEGGGAVVIDDEIAERLAEEFVEAATTGQEFGEERLDELVDEELGGPFLQTSVAEEFAIGTDDMNPPDAMREPLPRANAGMVQPSAEALGARAEDEAEGISREDEPGGPGVDSPRPGSSARRRR
jgi:hypothetical protein